MQSVEKIAEVVPYEGYPLYPYRHSALKNQQRWTFGGVYPRQYSEVGGGDDPWVMQTQCLVVGDEDTRLEVKVRFLHIVDRRVAEPASCSASALPRPVEALRVGEQVYRFGEEAIEREICPAERAPRPDAGRAAPGALRLGDLSPSNGCWWPIDVPAGTAQEPLLDPAGELAGLLVRTWQPVQGRVEIAAEPLATSTAGTAGERRTPYRLTVRITNTTPWPQGERGGRARPAALRHTLISRYTILRVQGGEFVSLLEPPPEYQEAATACANLMTWPVLVGEAGERHTLLSSPIILYDYPQVAPESPGDYFDATEIDELLTLSVMALTDEEKQEMRESDPRARAILERTAALSPQQVLRLHGVIRGLRPATLHDERARGR